MSNKPFVSIEAPDGTVYTAEGGGAVTSESIENALGYKPLSGKGGTDGQFAISDGQGGIRWVSLTNVGEVGA